MHQSHLTNGMKEIPKLQDHQIPEGYFEELPDQIMERIHQKPTLLWAKMAVAAMLVLGVGIWQMTTIENEVSPLSYEQESELYIESEFWSEEEILSMSTDPNAILDEILSEEIMDIENLWTEEEQTWF